MARPIHKARTSQVPVSVLATDSASSASNLTTYTFSGLSIGAASPGRVVVAIFSTKNGASTRSFSSMTIGGVSVTAVSAEFSSSGTNICAVGWAYILTGTTVEVTATLSGAMDSGAVSIIAIDNVKSVVALDSATDGSADAPSITLDEIKGGIIVAGFSGEASGTAITFTGITELHDFAAEGHRHASAYDLITTTALGQSISTNDNGSRNALVGVTLR